MRSALASGWSAWRSRSEQGQKPSPVPERPEGAWYSSSIKCPSLFFLFIWHFFNDVGQVQRVKQVFPRLFPIEIASVGSGNHQEVQVRRNPVPVLGQHRPDVALETVAHDGRVTDLLADRDADAKMLILLSMQDVDHKSPVGN